MAILCNFGGDICHNAAVDVVLPVGYLGAPLFLVNHKVHGRCGGPSFNHLLIIKKGVTGNINSKNGLFVGQAVLLWEFLHGVKLRFGNFCKLISEEICK